MEVALIVIAIVCFVLAALALLPRFNWIAIGLAFFALAHMAERLIVAIE